MFSKKVIWSVSMLTIAAMIALVGCSSDQNERKGNVDHRVVDSVAATFAEAVVNTEPADQPVSTVEPGRFVGFNDLKIVGPTLFAVYDGGVVIYDLTTDTRTDLNIGENFNAVVLHNDKIFVGGEKLYEVRDKELYPVEIGIEGAINDLSSFSYRLLIGTETGLYSFSTFGLEKLMDDVAVSRLAGDKSGVWVGTDGDGLYRWDGTEFQKRYLQRDETLFNYVTALDYNHDHLYLGTDSGMYIYDGGSWTTLTTENGLPGNQINDIDASQWVVYIATDMGIVSYFDKDFIPVKKLEETVALSLEIADRKIIFGTYSEGLQMRVGPTIKVLVDPDDEQDDGTVAATLN